MTKQVLRFIFLILISAVAAFSQTTEQQVAKIRAIYAETNKRIDAGLKNKTSGFHYAAWTVGGRGDGAQWAAVGAMETRDEIWFEGGDAGAAEEEEDARPMIRKIVSSYTRAADLHSRAEYFFDETGALIFIFASSDADSGNGKMIERRFYYASGKLLRVVRGDGKNTDTNFSAKDLEESRDESDGAKQMQQRFAALLGK